MAHTKETPSREELLQEVEELKSRLDSYEEAQDRSSKKRNFIARKLGSFLILGPRLKNSLNKIQEGDLSKDNISELLIAILYRFTRIGVFAVIVALVPIILLYQQNKLLSNQNALFTEQNKKIDTQTKLLESQDKKFGAQNEMFDKQTELLGNQNSLFTDQNEKIDIQTSLLRRQDEKFGSQNEMFAKQTILLDSQNIRLNIQNNLIEADRRSSLVFLMSNVLDKVDEEIAEQRKKLVMKGNTRGIPDSIKYRLSDPLVGRIVALSRAFKPYRVMQGDTLSGELQSPERGQLFISLMNSNLDSASQQRIVSEGDFSNAIIGRVNLREANLRDAKMKKAYLFGADLEGANLRYAKLYDVELILANLRFANLRQADLDGASLKRAYLKNANLTDADLVRVDFWGANSITYEQLIRARNLYGCRGLSPALEAKLKKVKPCLFKYGGCSDWKHWSKK